MERMLIKHLSGSKANQVEEFALKHHNELVFGRETPSNVKYDPDRDDLVGRQHAKITRDPNDPEGFLIEDLNSRNGTFLNKQRISGKTKVHPGDYVQLGPGGPEFQFEVEPRPANSTKATRIAEAAAFGKVSPETRVVNTNVSGSGGAMSNSIPTAPMNTTKPPGTVGKATVERMISHTVTETKKSQGRKFGVIGGAAALAVLILFGVVIGGAYYYNSKQQAAREQKEQEMKDQLAVQQKEASDKQAALEKNIAEDKANAPVLATEISDKYGKAVVWIQGSFQLVNKASKSQIYHQFIPNSREFLTNLYKQDYGKGPIIENGGNRIPVYFKTDDSYEPALTDQKTELSEPIGAAGYTCSGFIVTSDGFILTNRHCTSPWKAQYSFPQGYPAGILIGEDGKILGAGVPAPRDWIPDNTKSKFSRQYQGAFDAQQKLFVQLPGTDNPIEAQKIQDSPRHDVGMLKISVPGSLPKVELEDDYDTIKKGESLVIMGYPGNAPKVYAPIKSQNFLNDANKGVVIPDPTVTVTAVGNVVRNSNPNEQNNVRMSDFGDTIRYAGGLTFGGNSGGPVFNSKGHVIGLHFAGDSSGAGNFTGFAVPIRYGMQLFPGGADSKGSNSGN